MLVGILSDTHDRVDAMAAAMDVLRKGGAQFFIHCGDVGSERVIDHLAGVPSAFVFGNTDWDRATLARYADRLGVACYGSLADLELGGKHFAVIHGDDFRLKQRLLAEQRHDYLLQGHTHVRADERVGKVRLINPGALHRAREKTVAVLDTGADRLTFLPGEPPVVSP
jgi:putative phosphoesterase